MHDNYLTRLASFCPTPHPPSPPPPPPALTPPPLQAVCNCEHNPVARAWLASPSVEMRMKAVVAKMVLIICAVGINVGALAAPRARVLATQLLPRRPSRIVAAQATIPALRTTCGGTFSAPKCCKPTPRQPLTCPRLLCTTRATRVPPAPPAHQPHHPRQPHHLHHPAHRPHHLQQPHHPRRPPRPRPPRSQNVRKAPTIIAWLAALYTWWLHFRAIPYYNNWVNITMSGMWLGIAYTASLLMVIAWDPRRLDAPSAARALLNHNPTVNSFVHYMTEVSGACCVEGGVGGGSWGARPRPHRQLENLGTCDRSERACCDIVGYIMVGRGPAACHCLPPHKPTLDCALPSAPTPVAERAQGHLPGHRWRRAVPWCAHQVRQAPGCSTSESATTAVAFLLSLAVTDQACCNCERGKSSSSHCWRRGARDQEGAPPARSVAAHARHEDC